jgi:hypothetical protein
MVLSKLSRNFSLAVYKIIAANPDDPAYIALTYALEKLMKSRENRLYICSLAPGEFRTVKFAIKTPQPVKSTPKKHTHIRRAMRKRNHPRPPKI